MPEPTPHTTPDAARQPDGLTPSAPDPRATTEYSAAAGSLSTPPPPPAPVPGARTDDPAAAGLPAAPPTGAARYTLLDEIARGGMGAVYHATDTALSREVAVKVLQERYAPDSAAARRFAAEARITAQLQHPAIPPVHDWGSLPDGRPFLAMKLIRGRTLDDLLRQRGDPAAERGRFLAVFEQVCQAVAYAHAHRVIHRDLKPGNVMVGGFGEVQVMDWGLAKVLTEAAAASATEGALSETVAGTLIRGSDAERSETQEGSILGTLAYMPPEQAAGEIGKVDQRSDVFGLGAILAVILTGAPPYAGTGAEAVRVMAIRGDLWACLDRLGGCGAEPELLGLCKRCLAFAPAERPRDAGAVAEEIAGLRAAAEERARAAERERVAAEARAAEQRRKRRWQLAAAATVVLALLGAVGGLAAYLRAQKQANADLQAAGEREHERFELALDAVKTFHTGVSEDALLKQPEFKNLRGSLLGQAAQFYGKLQKMLEGQPDPASQRDLAQSYFLLAELEQNLGSTDEAQASYRKALELRRALVARGEPSAELDVARSLRGLALVFQDRGDFAAMKEAAQEATDTAEAAGSSEEAQSVLVDSLHSLGLACYKLRDWGGTLRYWQQALEVIQRLADAKPGDPALRRKLAARYANVAIGLRLTGKKAEALRMQQKAVEIADEVARTDPGDWYSEDGRARTHLNYAASLGDMEKYEEAASEIARAVEIEQKVLDAYPAVLTLKNNQAFFLNNLGMAYRGLERPEPSLQAYRRAAKILQELADAYPAVIGHRSNLGESRTGIALALQALGKPDEAVAECDQALAIFRQLTGDPPKRYFPQMAEALGVRGVALQKLGRPGEAAASYREAITLLEKFERPGPGELYNLASFYALLHGVAPEKGSGVTTADADAAADKAVATLRRALAAGYSERQTLRKDTAFESLRKRPDFQKLLADLAKDGTGTGK